MTYEDGKPAVKVVVLIDGTILQVETNNSGEYRFRGIGRGTYTIVALQPGFAPARRENIEVKRGARLNRIDLVLKRDANYVPDAIKLTDMVPPPDSILPPNTPVEIKGIIRYRLRNDPTARVVLSFQDDQKNHLLKDQPRFDIKGGSASFDFKRTVRTPARFGNADMYVAVALIPGTSLQIVSSHLVKYQIRNFKDDMQIASLGFSETGAGDQSIRFVASIRYVLDTVVSGTIRLRLMGDRGSGDYEDVLLDKTYPIDRQQAPGGVLSLDGTPRIATQLKQFKLRMDLLPTGAPDPKLIKWSDGYPNPFPAKVEDKRKSARGS